MTVIVLVTSGIALVVFSSSGYLVLDLENYLTILSARQRYTPIENRIAVNN